MKHVAVLTVALFSAPIAMPTVAQVPAWPTTPLRLVVPFPPAASIDNRAEAAKLSKVIKDAGVKLE